MRALSGYEAWQLEAMFQAQKRRAEEARKEYQKYFGLPTSGVKSALKGRHDKKRIKVINRNGYDIFIHKWFK